MGVPKGKSAQKWRFCARGWLPRAQQRPPELSTARHKPFGVHLAAVRQATDCRNLPRNLPLWRYRRGTTAKSYRRVLPAAHTTVHTAVALPPWNYRKKLPPYAAAGTPVAVQPGAVHTTVHTPVQPTCRGILPRDGSCAQRAGDSDVGANDKGAGDDPGDGVDAH